jgi:ADP-ribose pyrophosphatase YjhB (NUDIX family)
MKEAVRAIRDSGVVTSDIRKKYFEGKGISAIRMWLDENGLDRHMPIELHSVDIAIVTPIGVMLQIRHSDNDQLGLFGGSIIDDETPEECAIRKIKEQTGIEVSLEQLQYVEESDHLHQYANGDKGIFHSYRYKVEFDHVPQVKEGSDYADVYFVAHTVLSHQTEFIKRLLGEH